jgi:ribosomal protein L7/L12
MSQPQVLPPEVIQALERGKLLEAVKLLRKTRGLGLAEAKQALEAHGRGLMKRGAAAAAEAPGPEHAGQRGDVMEALQAGNKIEAIRRMRESTGMGLKEAKEAVDALEGNFGFQHRAGLAPGEVPPTSNRFVWVVLAVAAALIFWFLWRR